MKDLKKNVVAMAWVVAGVLVALAVNAMFGITTKVPKIG